MAKKATAKAGGKSSSRSSKKTGTSVARVSSSGKRGGSRSSDNVMGDAFIKLLQSPLVAELVAVAATAALAALAEHSFTTGNDATRGKRVTWYTPLRGLTRAPVGAWIRCPLP